MHSRTLSSRAKRHTVYIKAEEYSKMLVGGSVLGVIRKPDFEADSNGMTLLIRALPANDPLLSHLIFKLTLQQRGKVVAASM